MRALARVFGAHTCVPARGGQLEGDERQPHLIRLITLGVGFDQSTMNESTNEATNSLNQLNNHLRTEPTTERLSRPTNLFIIMTNLLSILQTPKIDALAPRPKLSRTALKIRL